MTDRGAFAGCLRLGHPWLQLICWLVEHQWVALIKTCWISCWCTTRYANLPTGAFACVIDWNLAVIFLFIFFAISHSNHYRMVKPATAYKTTSIYPSPYQDSRLPAMLIQPSLICTCPPRCPYQSPCLCWAHCLVQATVFLVESCDRYS